MADPIQTARIVEAMAEAVEPIVEQAHHHGEPVKLNSDFIDEILAAALSTAYPMIREEMARACDALAANPDWQSPIARETARYAFEEAATVIRATELAKGEE